MKKPLIYLVAGLLILALAGSLALAAPPQDAVPQNPGPGGYYGPGPGWNQQANLTDAQKQEWSALRDQMFGIRKQMIQKQVEWGNITQAQADQWITVMEQRKDSDYGPGVMGRGMGSGPGMGGRGPGFCGR